jgi:hypothetical protein
MGEGGEVGDWISGAEAAEIMGVHRNTVYLSLTDETRRAAWWGTEGEGWRYKPLSERKIYEVNRKRAEDIAAGRWPPKDSSGPSSAGNTPAEQ